MWLQTIEVLGKQFGEQLWYWLGTLLFPRHQGELLLPSESLHLWTPGESLLLAGLAFIWQAPPGHRTNGSRDAGNHFQPRTAAKELSGRMWEAQRVMVNAAVTAASLGMPFLKDSMGTSRGMTSPAQAGLRGPLHTGLTILPILSPMSSLVKGHPGLRGCQGMSVLSEVSKETFFMGKRHLVMDLIVFQLIGLPKD